MLRRASKASDIPSQKAKFWNNHRTSEVCTRASGMHLRGSGHEFFCSSVAAWLSRSRAPSRAYIVQRVLSDLGPHDNIVQRLYLLRTRGSILLVQGSIKGELVIMSCTEYTPFFVKLKGLIFLYKVLGVQSQSIQTSLDFNLFWILSFVSDLVCSTTS